MADYFTEVESAINEAQREDPNVVLPWSWWKKQGERHGMTPNAVWTRAVKSGLYVPPAKRDGPAPTKAPVPAPSRAAKQNGPSVRVPAAPSRPSDSKNPPQDPALAPDPPILPTETIPSASSANASASLLSPGGIGDALQGLSSLLERAAGLERQVEELTQALEQAREENRRLRRTLRETDALAEKIRQNYLASLNPE